MLRAIIAPIGVFILVSLIGFAFLSWYTSSTWILDQKVIDAATEAASQDDALLLPEADASEASSEPMTSQLDMRREEALNGLLTWLQCVAAAGLVLSMAWALQALLKQKRVYGPAGQSSARPAWLVIGVLYMAAMGGLLVGVMGPLHLEETMNDLHYYAAVVGIGLSGLIAYWIVTSLAASAVMRPSVL